MFKAVIFDFDGTLVDSEWAYALTDEALVKSLGGDPAILYKKNLIGNGVRTFLQSLLDELGIKNRSINELVELNDKIFLDIAEGEVDLFPVMLELVKDLHHRRIPMAIASNTSTWVLQAMAQECGITRFIDKIYSADMVDNDKPSPELYLFTAEKMGVNPEECLVFEDSEVGVISALEAGMKVVWLDTFKKANGNGLKERVFFYYPGGHNTMNSSEILELFKHV